MKVTTSNLIRFCGLALVPAGIVFAGINADWYKAFIGIILLLAVLLNNYVRKLALETRR